MVILKEISIICENAGEPFSMCSVVSPLVLSKLGGHGSRLGRTSTQGFQTIEKKGLPLHWYN